MIGLAEERGIAAAFLRPTGCLPPAGLLYENGLRGGCESMSEPDHLLFIMMFPAMISPGRERPPAACKKALKQVGLAPDVIRKVAIAMYEGEINMVIHAGGGQDRLWISPPMRSVWSWRIRAPALPMWTLAMQAGWSTAPDRRTLPGLWCRHGSAQYEEIYRRDGDREPPWGLGTTVPDEGEGVPDPAREEAMS